MNYEFHAQHIIPISQEQVHNFRAEIAKHVGWFNNLIENSKDGLLEPSPHTYLFFLRQSSVLYASICKFVLANIFIIGQCAYLNEAKIMYTPYHVNKIEKKEGNDVFEMYDIPFIRGETERIMLLCRDMIANIDSSADRLQFIQKQPYPKNVQVE